MEQIITVIVIATAIWYTLKVRKEAKNGSASDFLSKGEKVYVWVSSLLNPVVSGAIFYYGWKKLLPQKAQKANHISLWAFLIELIIVFILFLLLPTN